MSDTTGARRGTGGVGEALFGALPGLAMAALVAATSGGERALPVLSSVVLPFVALSWLSAAARRRLERDDDRYVRWVVGASAAISLALVALALFGAVLKTNTHHKSLAGVTYAIVSLGVLAACAVVGARLGGMASRWSSGSALRHRTVLGLALLVVVNVLILALRRGELLRFGHLEALGALISFGGGFFLRAPRRVARGDARP